MKRLATLTCLLFLVTELALAQGGGSVCLFSDPLGTNCTLSDTAPGALSVYVIHTQAPGVKAVQFSVPKPSCMHQARFLCDLPVFAVTIGNSQDGVLVNYGTCRLGPVHVMTILYLVAGTTSLDCPYPVLPDPDVGRVEATDCNDNKIEAQGGMTYINSSLPCVCAHSSTPLLGVTPLSLDFGEITDTRSFTISNNGQGTLAWDVSGTVPWLSVSPTSGTGNATITASVDRSGLPAGSHSGLITVTSNGGNETVTATMVVPVPVLRVSPTALVFPTGLTYRYLSVSNTGNGNLNWSISSDQTWLWANPASGTNNTQVTAHIDRSGLGEPTYNGNLFVTSNGGNATIPVAVVGGPDLRVDPSLLVFSESLTTNTFTITNAGGGTLDWSLSASQSWIEIAPPLSGTGNATVQVNVDPESVPCCDMRSGGVTVNSNGGVRLVEVRFDPPELTAGGSIGIYADPAGVDCNIRDVPSGLMTVYIVHTNTAGATASQFSAPKPACMTGATWLSDTAVFPVTLGNSQTGVTVGYGSCRAEPIHVLTMNYLVTDPSQSCCMYRVLPDPGLGSGKVEVVDCAFNLQYGTGNTSTVNANSSCLCGLESVIPTEQTTWGHMKALYAPESSESIRK